VPDLFLYPNFIDENPEQQLLNEIVGQVWLVDCLGRLQYYGFRNELEKTYDIFDPMLSKWLLMRNKMIKSLLQYFCGNTYR
jgi:hypothetical protein